VWSGFVLSKPKCPKNNNGAFVRSALRGRPPNFPLARAAMTFAMDFAFPPLRLAPMVVFFVVMPVAYHSWVV
jgi:hypothetical protein